MKRNTISREFFSTIAGVLVLGLMLLCAIQTALSTAYFYQERRDTLTSILDGATALSQRYAAQGHLVLQPIQDDEVKENTRNGYELFNTANGAVVFVADAGGRVLFHTGEDELTADTVPGNTLQKMEDGQTVFMAGTMNGLLPSKYYVAGRRLTLSDTTGYLFVASPMDAMYEYVQDMMRMFLLSSLLILVVCGALCMVFARRITGPIEAISEAARRLGTGDFTARAPVTGCEELADFATTFNNMAARLQTIDNSRGQFMGNIAHELRTPMTTIKGFIDGMLDGTIPPESRDHYLGIVSEEVGRLTRLIKNMLDITKLEAGEYQVNARNYDIWESITSVVFGAEQRLEANKIQISGFAPTKTMVYADEDLVYQVIYNIVDNAIKFCNVGGEIRFSVTQARGMVTVGIRNTGAGISADALPYVFDRFYKEDKSRGLNTMGSGLGLHICKVLINLSGGNIWAESKEGEYCQFNFTLPVAVQEKNKQKQTRTKPEEEKGDS